MDLKELRKTAENKFAGGLRLMVGLIFLGAGLVKFINPTLEGAFARQLEMAQIPFVGFNMIFIPIVEVAVGLALLIGIYSRVWAALVIVLMIVATYVHSVVDDPSMFPLQPNAPVIPVMLIIIGGYLAKVGGGSWSWDIGCVE